MALVDEESLKASHTLLLENLRQLSGDDLRRLCFELGVDDEALPIATLSKIEKSRALIQHLERRERLLELVQWGVKNFPNLPWPTSTTFTTSAVLYSEPEVLDAPSQLFGRSEFIVKVKGLLSEYRSVLLVGLGGIGKTAVAATLANQYASGGGQIIWVKTGQALCLRGGHFPPMPHRQKAPAQSTHGQHHANQQAPALRPQRLKTLQGLHQLFSIPQRGVFRDPGFGWRAPLG